MKASKTTKYFLYVFVALKISSAPMAYALTSELANLPEAALENTLKRNPQRIDIREHLAELYLKRHQWPKVIETLNPFTDVASPSAFLTLASAYQESQDFASAVRILSLLSDKAPKDAEVQYALGDARLKAADGLKELKSRQEMEGAAIENFRSTLRLKKNFRPAHEALVNYFLHANLNLEAREQLNEMLRIFGQRGEIHADLCRLFSVDGFLAQAIKHCKRAIQLSPRFPNSYVYLAQTYFDQKNQEMAESSLIEAAQKFPRSEFVQYGAGAFFLKKSNFPVATKYLARAVENSPSSARAQLGYAQALFESGQEKAALAHFSLSCRADSKGQTELLAAAAKLRLKNQSSLATQYSQAAATCRH